MAGERLGYRGQHCVYFFKDDAECGGRVGGMLPIANKGGPDALERSEQLQSGWISRHEAMCGTTAKSAAVRNVSGLDIQLGAQLSRKLGRVTGRAPMSGCRRPVILPGQPRRIVKIGIRRRESATSTSGC